MAKLRPSDQYGEAVSDGSGGVGSGGSAGSTEAPSLCPRPLRKKEIGRTAAHSAIAWPLLQVATNPLKAPTAATAAPKRLAERR
eukprot:CAMPEP_0176141746 /NCGR_PEP_ID=MMETSP0120_2-20121206/72084_1 /TAXON_ID=160619 /ORGANISM="Kryptoperidinium foliaceum, Strain CCMP 1326" /LENGTH=83 /DNA_ID=CAMNT_0017477901 /DNA_START=106 /DNA_END=354 /DNA_ORIENTATION=-